MSYTEMLAQFGISSAHPGGFAATLEQIQHFKISKESRILEIGCGTGRTACFLAQNGYQLTAVDSNTDMLNKAKQRAASQDLNISFVEADACSLPFEDEQFDVILIESVTNFTDATRALSEYYRVLKHGGVLYDREIIEVSPISSVKKRSLLDFFGFKQLLSWEQWSDLLTGAKFEASSWDYSHAIKENTDQYEHPDNFQTLDHEILSNIKALQTAVAYTVILDDYKDYLGSIVLVGSK